MRLCADWLPQVSFPWGYKNKIACWMGKLYGFQSDISGLDTLKWWTFLGVATVLGELQTANQFGFSTSQTFEFFHSDSSPEYNFH